MKNVLTPELSKAARRERGLSQRDVIAGAAIQAYKLKQWEGRGLTIELGDIRKLTDFYESIGVDLDALAEHTARAEKPAARGAAEPLQAGFTYNPRPGFIISDQLAPEIVDKLMERMDENDNRIGELTEASFKPGFLGGISDDTEAKTRELFGALAENHVIFRFLQGRNIIAPTRDEPKTLASYLAQLLQESPAHSLLTGEAVDLKKAAPTAPKSDGLTADPVEA